MAERCGSWSPGLDNDHLTIDQILENLPLNRQDEIPWAVWLLENPRSPVAFPGAIGLERHDVVHALLGRGLLPQDEAFVVGFTMGTARTLSPRAQRAFKALSRWAYPSGYRWSPDHLKVFDLGFDEGSRPSVVRLYDYPLELHRHRTAGELRLKLGICTATLRRAYQREQLLVPHSAESARLGAGSGERAAVAK